jgi:hypothetical protein
MYAMNIQNDVIGLVLRKNCKSKQVTDFIAWPSRCHDTISDTIYKATPTKDLLSYKPPLLQGHLFSLKKAWHCKKGTNVILKRRNKEDC